MKAKGKKAAEQRKSNAEFKSARANGASPRPVVDPPGTDDRAYQNDTGA
jgi:hypothetical protein